MRKAIIFKDSLILTSVTFRQIAITQTVKNSNSRQAPMTDWGLKTNKIHSLKKIKIQASHNNRFGIKTSLYFWVSIKSSIFGIQMKSRQ